MKWKDYDLSDCTWEPSVHLPRHVLEGFFSTPLSSDRLLAAAYSLENAVKSRLRSRNVELSVECPGDILRFAFKTGKEVLLQTDDFNRLPLPQHWDYELMEDVNI